MKETLGQKIARLRKEKNYTQEDLAKRFNVSTQAVSKWENNLSAPDISILKDLANLLGVSVDYLLSNERDEVVDILPEENRKPINKMLLKIKIASGDGEKININLPMPIIFACINAGAKIPSLNGSEALNSIDFKEIIKLVEQGVVGELVNIEGSDGDVVIICVE